MSRIQTYNDLVKKIKETTEDDSLEFEQYIPFAVDFAEERLMKELDFPELEATTDGTLTTRYLNKPTERLQTVLSFYIIKDSGERKEIKKRLSTYCYDYWPNPSLTSEPKYYFNSSDSQFQVVPTPDKEYEYKIRYQYYPQRLGPNRQSNYFLENNCKEALFYACMVNMVKFMKHWEQIQVWEQSYQQAALDWNSLAERQRRDGSVVPLNQEGVVPSVKHTSEGTNA